MIDSIKYFFHSAFGGSPTIEAADNATRVKIREALKAIEQATGKKLKAYSLTVRLVLGERMVQSKSLGYLVPVVKMNDGIDVCGYVTGRRRAPKITLVHDAAGNVPPHVLLHECAEAVARSNGKKTAHAPPYSGRIWGC